MAQPGRAQPFDHPGFEELGLVDRYSWRRGNRVLPLPTNTHPNNLAHNLQSAELVPTGPRIVEASAILPMMKLVFGF